MFYSTAGVLKLHTCIFLIYFGFLKLYFGNQIWKFMCSYFSKFCFVLLIFVFNLCEDGFMKEYISKHCYNKFQNWNICEIGFIIGLNCLFDYSFYSEFQLCNHLVSFNFHSDFVLAWLFLPLKILIAKWHLFEVFLLSNGSSTMKSFKPHARFGFAIHYALMGYWIIEKRIRNLEKHINVKKDRYT